MLKLKKFKIFLARYKNRTCYMTMKINSYFISQIIIKAIKQLIQIH